jgi:hypothetical protein
MDQATQVQRLPTVPPRLLGRPGTALREVGNVVPRHRPEIVTNDLRALNQRFVQHAGQAAKDLSDGPLGDRQQGRRPATEEVELAPRLGAPAHLAKRTERLGLSRVAPSAWSCCRRQPTC